MLRKSPKTKKKEILSDKIASLFTVAPIADVEDDQVFGTKPKTVTRDDLDSGSDSGEEAELSSFRKQNVTLLADLSKRYQGEVTSRKDLGFQKSNDKSVVSAETNESDNFDNGSDDESDIPDEDLDEKNDSEDDKDYEGFEDEENSGENDVESDENDVESDESDDDDPDDGIDLSQLDNAEGKQEFKHIKETDRSDDLKKGKCVKNQLSMWESLLEMRINMQKCLVTANKFPLPETFKRLKDEGGEKYNTALGRTKGSVASLFNRLLDLQTTLLSNYPETKDVVKKDIIPESASEDPMDEEIPSDSDSVSSEKPAPVEDKPKRKKKRKMADYAEDLAQRHNSYTKYRNSVIQKWYDKTRVSSHAQKNQPSIISTISQIEYILKDRNKLIKRTQLKRTKYDILGEKELEKIPETSFDDSNLPKDFDRRNLDEEYCPEIFDDDDFYHQLLRELIEHKSADVSDPIQLSRQWIMLQQMRSKMKRKIDTRATKGRRIRYAVHSKLVNFMAPNLDEDWTDDTKNELFASLFGKQFEGNNLDSVKRKKVVNNDNDLEV